jgi:hypothetical protein
VKRFLSSEFGYDLGNPQTAAITADIPIFGSKVNVNKYIKEKAGSNPHFTHTDVRTGAFVDWGLQKSFLVDLQFGKPRIFDDGIRPFTATTLETAA